MSRDRDERGDWTLDSEGGSRASIARSDGSKWKRADEAARDAKAAVTRVFGAGIRGDKKGRD